MIGKNKSVKNILIDKNDEGSSKSKNKHRSKGILRMMIKPLRILFVPLMETFKSQINSMYKGIKHGISEKLTGFLILMFAVLMLYSVFLGIGILIVIALYEFAHFSLFYSFLILVSIFICITIVCFIVGKHIIKKPFLKNDSE